MHYVDNFVNDTLWDMMLHKVEDGIMEYRLPSFDANHCTKITGEWIQTGSTLTFLCHSWKTAQKRDDA